VQATVDTLPDRYSDVLEWKYVDGLSVDEIAAQLNIGVKAAESLLTRAREAFRETFSLLSGGEAAGGLP
jgi:RNA polymerase sigma-70 factor (ECF subfamily)